MAQEQPGGLIAGEVWLFGQTEVTGDGANDKIYFFDLPSVRQFVGGGLGSGAYAGSAGGEMVTHTAALKLRRLTILARAGALIGNHCQIC